MALENIFALTAFTCNYDSRAPFSGHTYSAWSEGTDYKFICSDGVEYRARYADSANDSRVRVRFAGNEYEDSFWGTLEDWREFAPINWEDVPEAVREEINCAVEHDLSESDAAAAVLRYLEKYGDFGIYPDYWEVRGDRWDFFLVHWDSDDVEDMSFDDEEMDALRHGILTRRTRNLAAALGCESVMSKLEAERRVHGEPVAFAIRALASQKRLSVEGIEEVEADELYLVNTDDGKYYAKMTLIKEDEFGTMFEIQLKPVMTAGVSLRRKYRKLQLAWQNQIARVSALSCIPWSTAGHLADAAPESEKQIVEWGKRIRKIAGTANAEELHELRNCGVRRQRACVARMMNASDFRVENLSHAAVGGLAQYIALGSAKWGDSFAFQKG